jgi:hypothetical protein
MDLNDIQNEPDDVEQKSSNAREYVDISAGEMDDFFWSRQEKWDRFTHPGGEVCYGTRDYAPLNGDLILVVFSTIEDRKGKSRGKGNDAIRTVVWYLPEKMPITGRKKTLRIKTWKKNLTKKIEGLMHQGEDIVSMCEWCGNPMVRREGEYGEFLGCTNYPDCDYTEQL